MQRHTYVFATTMSGWSGAVFVKLNVAEHDWAGGGEARRRFLEEMAPGFAASLASAWGAAVIDLYSTTETGPIAVSVPGVAGHVVLCPDLFVEALDPSGEPVTEGELGELTVTGGRNPFLPLVCSVPLVSVQLRRLIAAGTRRA